MKLAFYILAVILFSRPITNAQTLDFTQLSTKDGLPAKECYNVIQDTKGYIWVFTEFGIVKHNGQRFIPVCTNIPATDQNAYAVYLHSTGKIYFANANGKIYYIENDSAITIKKIEDLSKTLRRTSGTIFQLYVDKDENIYFSAYSGSYLFNREENIVYNLSGKVKENDHYVQCNLIDKTCISKRKIGILFGGETTMALFEVNTKIGEVKINRFNHYSQENIHKIGSTYFFHTSEQIFKIVNNKIVHSLDLKGAVRSRVSPDNHIWILRNNGITVLDQNLTVLSTYLEGKMATDAFFDKQGGVWVTTIGDGVYYCNDRYKSIFNNPFGSSTRIDLIEKKDAALYFYSSDGRCVKKNESALQEIHAFTDKTFCTTIIELEKDYLLGTKRGIFLKNKKSGLLSEIKPGKESIYSKGIDFLAENTYINFCGESAILINDNTVKESALLPGKITCFARLNHANYLIGTKRGLWNYNWVKNEMTVFRKELGEQHISAISIRKGREVWVGTQGHGLFVIPYLTKNKPISLKNCPFPAIERITFFSKNGILLSTNIGVFMNRVSNYTLKSHWQPITASQANDIEVLGNELWIASTSGLEVAVLNKLNTENNYPIAIHSIYSGETYIPQNCKILNHYQNDLQFQFDFLNYRWPVKEFYFTLKGPTKLKGSILGNVLQIQNLGPGNYELKVFPMQGFIYNSKHYISKSFTIRHAFWQTLWFRIMVILSSIVLVVLVVTLYINAKRKQEIKAAEVRKLVAENKLTALKAQINPHFISNSLSAIQALIDSGEVDKANQYIAKFSLLIRYVLKYSDKSLTQLSEELKIIDLNVELEQLRFTNRFVFSKQIANDIDENELYIPPLITQPFIENAIWHGLLPLKNGRKPELCLKINKNDQYLIISIIDNGVGRKKAAEHTTIRNNISRESKGTHLIQERIQNLNRLHQGIEAKIEIEDLFNNTSTANGTCVTIYLPFNMIHNFEEQL